MNEIIPIGSLSYAQRARRTLHARGFWVRLVKSEGGKDTDGCIYGLEIRSEDRPRALSELRAEGIPTRIRP